MVLLAVLSGPSKSPYTSHWPCLAQQVYLPGWDVLLDSDHASCLTGWIETGLCEYVYKLAYCTKVKHTVVAPPTFGSSPAHHPLAGCPEGNVALKLKNGFPPQFQNFYMVLPSRASKAHHKI